MTDRDDTFAQAVDDVRSIIARDVAGGFRDTADIATSAVEVVAGSDREAEALRPLAEQALREALADHYAAQAEWPDRTDCDKLDEAFAELEARGIVCRQDFTCCGTCGTSEIGEQMAAAEDAGTAVRGYAFYHMQDTEGAVGGYGLYLNYGAVEDGEAAATAVGHELVEVLTAHGLTTTWNGSWQMRVHVALDWKRRRPLVAGFDCRPPRRPG